MSKVEQLRPGQGAVTPHLIVRDAAAAMQFYQLAFNAEEVCRMPGPDGRLMHAEIKIGGSFVFLCDEFPDMGARSPLSLGGSPVTLHLYVEDCDATFGQAVAAGAQVQMPPADMFWGDRYSKVADPFGHHWSIATHKEDLTPEEMARRGKAVMDEMAKAC